MKRRAVAVLVLGLLLTIGSSASAVETKFWGQYYMQGWYNKNNSLIDKDSPQLGDSTDQRNLRGASAFYTTRLRMNIDFEVAKGLTLKTRFTALDRKFSAPSTGDLKENIEWDSAAVSFATPIGLFSAGEAASSIEEDPVRRISWMVPIGNIYTGLVYSKKFEGGFIGKGTDNDCDEYTFFIMRRSANGSIGYRHVAAWANHMNYADSAFSLATGNGPVKAKIFRNMIFFTQKIGNLFIEMKTTVDNGKYLDWQVDANKSKNVDITWAWHSYWHVNYDLSPALVGFKFLYDRGDDPNTPDKAEGGTRQLYDDDDEVEPCLILWSKRYTDTFGPITGAISGTMVPTFGMINTKKLMYWMQNMWFYQAYGNYKITPKLTIGATYTYAYADKKPTSPSIGLLLKPASETNREFVGKKYGSELDVTLKYKIYDNLEYMIGAAYLWTGDYFKGTDTNAKLANNYLLTHKLTLSF